MASDKSQTPNLPTRLRETFKAWGLRNLGDEAADEIEALRALVIHYADQAGVPADEVRRVHSV